MNAFINALTKEQNLTRTENGAGALKSTLNACLDAFGSLGAMRKSDETEIARIFSLAFAEDRALAIKMAFYFRDIRGGQGARRQFRVILRWLAINAPEFVTKNFDNILEFGRGDDCLCLLDTNLADQTIAWIARQLMRDIKAYKRGESISLLAKWLPSENASSKQTKRYARKLIKGLNFKPAQYRKMLTTLRKYLDVTEVKMSAKRWSAIDYEKVPSKAGLQYGNAFERHDEARYFGYLKAVAAGKAKINANALYPVDIVHRVIDKYNASRKDVMLYDAMWENLPNVFETVGEETGICIPDVSGSMYGTPMEVAISLAMYCADKCRGPFKGHFITFSASPTLQTVTGANIVEKVHNLERADWSMNTNLEAVFDLILETARRNHCKPQDMPNKLYIISDMQFDQGCRQRTRWDYGRHDYDYAEGTFMDRIEREYAAAGYPMPTIVYWNVRQSNCGMFQKTFQGKDCCMVSGYSPSLFKAVIEGTTYVEEEVTLDDGTTTTIQRAKINPMDMMYKTLNNERYDVIWTGVKA